MRTELKNSIETPVRMNWQVRNDGTITVYDREEKKVVEDAETDIPLAYLSHKMFMNGRSKAAGDVWMESSDYTKSESYIIIKNKSGKVVFEGDRYGEGRGSFKEFNDLHMLTTCVRIYAVDADGNIIKIDFTGSGRSVVFAFTGGRVVKGSKSVAPKKFKVYPDFLISGFEQLKEIGGRKNDYKTKTPILETVLIPTSHLKTALEAEKLLKKYFDYIKEKYAKKDVKDAENKAEPTTEMAQPETEKTTDTTEPVQTKKDESGEPEDDMPF